MNTLEWQVTSLELSKKLKERGVKQESLFWWTQHKTNKPWEVLSHHIYAENFVSAFTVAELFLIYYELTGNMKADILVPPQELVDHLAEEIIKIKAEDL